MEENGVVDFDIENCIICYIPKMICTHRTVWMEEHLLLFLVKQQEIWSSMLDVELSNDGHLSRRKVFLHSIDHDDIQKELRTIISGHLQISEADIPSALMPAIYLLDAINLITVLELLPFA